MKEIKLDQLDTIVPALEDAYTGFSQSLGRVYDWAGLARTNHSYANLVDAAITELTLNSWVRWESFIQVDAHANLRHLHGLTRTLPQMKTMLLDYVWPEDDRETVLGALSRLYVGVTLFLASQRPKISATRPASGRPELPRHISPLCSEIATASDQGLSFLAQVVQGNHRYAEPFTIGVQQRLVDDLFFQEFLGTHERLLDNPFLAGIASYLDRACHAPSDTPAACETSKQLAVFLNFAIVFVKRSLNRYDSRNRHNLVSEVISELLPKAFAAIGSCLTPQLLDMSERLLKSCRLLPVNREGRLRKDLRDLLRNLAHTYLDDWRSRTRDNPLLADPFAHAMGYLRPALDGIPRDPSMRFFLGGKLTVSPGVRIHLCLPALNGESNPPADTDPSCCVPCSFVDVSADLSGIRVGVMKTSLVQHDHDPNVVFTDGTGAARFAPLRECSLRFVFPRPSEPRKGELIAAIARYDQFKPPRINPDDPVAQIGGKISFDDDETAALLGRRLAEILEQPVEYR